MVAFNGKQTKHYSPEGMVKNFVYAFFAFLGTFYSIVFLADLFALPLSHHAFLSFIFYSGNKIIPFLLSTFYIFDRYNDSKLLHRITTMIVWTFINAGILFLVILFAASTMHIPFATLVGFDWSYTAAIEWTLAFLISFFIFRKKTRRTEFSFIVSALSMHPGSLLYEIPYFCSKQNFPVFLFSKEQPLFISSACISLLLLALILHDLKWKLNKIFYASLLFFIIFSVLYYLYGNVMPEWLPRLSAMIMFLSIPFTLTNRLAITKASTNRLRHGSQR